MKKSLIAALVIVAMVGCNKETAEATDPTAQVAATFTSAAITRVTDNAWDTNDKIGITMTESGSNPICLADGDYENVSYTVSNTTSGTFSPTAVTAPAVAETIYFPVDGAAVDFYAYYPFNTTYADGDISISVASQVAKDIDLIRATATTSKSSPAVKFTDDGTTDASFKHQLSKLTLTLEAGDGLTDLTDLKTTIKGQPTTATYNIFTTLISNVAGYYVEDNIENAAIVMTPTTTIDGTDKTKAYTSAILLPTSGTASSTIVFTLGDDDYIWDTKGLALVQGSEHNYEITITKTPIVVEGATIAGWGDGADGSGTAE